MYICVDVMGGSGNIVWYVDGFYCDIDNVDILGFVFIEFDEDELNGVLESSVMEMCNVVVGLFYVVEEGYFGFVVE